jgi:hypothetical protein
MSNPKSVVLVHGGFVDGSGWEGVYHILRQSSHWVNRRRAVGRPIAGCMRPRGRRSTAKGETPNLYCTSGEARSHTIDRHKETFNAKKDFLNL